MCANYIETTQNQTLQALINLGEGKNWSFCRVVATGDAQKVYASVSVELRTKYIVLATYYHTYISQVTNDYIDLSTSVREDPYSEVITPKVRTRVRPTGGKGVVLQDARGIPLGSCAWRGNYPKLMRPLTVDEAGFSGSLDAKLLTELGQPGQTTEDANNTIGRTPKGRTLQGGVLGTFWKPPFSEPLLRTLLRTLFYCKAHRKPPSQNPSENPFPRTLPRTFSERFSERCVAVRPLRRAPYTNQLTPSGYTSTMKPTVVPPTAALKQHVPW